MASTPLKYADDVYGGKPARPGLLSRARQRIVRSPWLARALFGMRVNPARLGDGYFDLTTILLRRELRMQIRRYMYPRLLEIGVGRFAILAGHLSRRVRQRVVACDFDQDAVGSAGEHVESNGVNVEVLQSDVLAGIPVNEYDLLFWNLPQTDNVAPLLTRLFSTVPGYMSGSARLILGFNARRLPVDTVLDVLTHFPALRLEERRRYWWNKRGILVIRKA